MDVVRYVCAMVLILQVQGSADQRRLVHELLKDYDKLVGPVPVNVTHSLQLKRIISLEDQVLSLDAWISMQWHDSQLMWDPDQYGDVSMVRIPSNHLWQPDIMLENNAEQFSGVHSGDINMVITYDGVVFYIPPVKIKSYCSVDMSRIRRHKQVTCSLKFMSWTYDGLSLDLDAGPKEGIMDGFDPYFNEDWELIDVEVDRNVLRYSCCPEPYIDIVYKLFLKRRD